MKSTLASLVASSMLSMGLLASAQNPATEVGKDTKTAATKTGHATKKAAGKTAGVSKGAAKDMEKAGDKTASVTKDAAKDTGKAAEKTGHGVKKGVKSPLGLLLKLPIEDALFRGTLGFGIRPGVSRHVACRGMKSCSIS